MKGWLAAALIAALVATFGLGAWAGIDWCNGRHAKTALANTKAERDTAQQDLADYHAQLQQASAQFATDAAALRSIAEDYANGRNDQQAFYAAHNAKLEAFLASRPDLAACDIGPVGLGLWNAANRGAAAAADPAGAGAAATASGPEPAGGMSGLAAGVERQAAGSAAQPRTSNRAVPRLPAPPARSVPRSEDARSAGSGAAATRAGSVGRSRAALIPTAGDDGW